MIRWRFWTRRKRVYYYKCCPPGHRVVSRFGPQTQKIPRFQEPIKMKWIINVENHTHGSCRSSNFIWRLSSWAFCINVDRNQRRITQVIARKPTANRNNGNPEIRKMYARIFEPVHKIRKESNNKYSSYPTWNQWPMRIMEILKYAKHMGINIEANRTIIGGVIARKRTDRRTDPD